MAMTKWGKEGFEWQAMGQRPSDLTDLAKWVSRETETGGPAQSVMGPFNASMVLADMKQKNSLEDDLIRSKIASENRANRPAPTGPSKASIGTEQLTPRRKAEDNYSWWEREQMDRQKAERDNAQGLKFTMDKRNQDMSFLQKLLGLMGSGGMGGGNAGSGGSGGFNRSSNEGYTEQIFNSAGAPQIVRLKNGNQGSNSNQSDILKMLMGMMG